MNMTEIKCWEQTVNLTEPSYTASNNLKITDMTSNSTYMHTLIYNEHHIKSYIYKKHYSNIEIYYI